MKLVFVDQDPDWKNLLPLTYTKPTAKLRVGILTIEEKWQHHLNEETAGFITESYLQAAYPINLEESSFLYINASHLPNPELIEAITQLEEGAILFQNNNWIAFKGSEIEGINNASPVPYLGEINKIDRPWDLIQNNAEEIINDFIVITGGRSSISLEDKHTVCYHPENIFIEEGATVRASILNAENGPIYIGKNAKIHEGAIIKGPFALLEEGQVGLGSKIREGCTIGYKAVGSGELKNSIIGDFSNKGHEGYLGDSVLGNWCNLGALTNVSNLKNTYSDIKVWDRSETAFINTHTNKLGCIIGDYVHTGISTTINTGSIFEPFCQLFGAGLHPKFVPAYRWGEPNKYEDYKLNKALETAFTLHQLKNEEISPEEIEILKAIYELINA